jgi:GNAT superfamily N-acetyltransferase
MRVDFTITFLEMTAPDQLRPRRSSRTDLNIVCVQDPLPELNRFFYTAVGGDWYWLERLPWTYRQWLDYLCRPELETWMLLAGGVPAGYFEQEMQPGGSAEIAYFGLLPTFIGQGLGAHLLTAAVERGWERGARRVWLHTCTLDHPSALANYQARGFRIYDKQQVTKELPAQAPGPWPGARPQQG